LPPQRLPADDSEYHEELATRFGVAACRSKENRFNQNRNVSTVSVAMSVFF
jgi:hypothetical protein